jgi:hypothetical protein
MPARAERIYLFPADEDQPGRVMRFPVWWDRRGFFDKYGDRKIDTGNPFYVDYALLLTQGEALVWDKACREKFSGDFRSRRRNLELEMQQLEAALKKSRWVIVESYEWESGLD